MASSSSSASPSDAQIHPHEYNPDTGNGRWEYLEKIGEGSYGRIWKVRDWKNFEKKKAEAAVRDPPEVYSAPVVALKVSKYSGESPQVYMLHREYVFSTWIHEGRGDSSKTGGSSSSSSSPASPAVPDDGIDRRIFLRYLEDCTRYKRQSSVEDRQTESELRLWEKGSKLDDLREKGHLQVDEVCTF